MERLIGGEIGMDRHRENWTEQEYETLFGRHPADVQPPSEEEADELAMELGRTTQALLWQWQDGANYVQQKSASTMSDVLKEWLDRRGRP